MLMALLTVVSVIPTSTVMEATEKATITFEYAYDSNVGLWIILAGVSVVGLAIFGYLLKRKKK